MNSLLVQYRPKDSSKEEWEKTWNNSSYSLQPLADVIKKQIKDLDSIKASDFDCPNHYAKLAYQAGQKDKLEYILNLLPDSVSKD